MNETAHDISVLIAKANKEDSDDKAQKRSQPQNPEFRNNPEYFYQFLHILKDFRLDFPNTVKPV